jgi:hypothetical protein
VVTGTTKKYTEMRKQDIAKQYYDIVNSIEDAKMYDGRNTVDRYICDMCGCMIHTTYKDKGVTPFTIRCPKCNGTMYHRQTFRKDTVPNWVKVRNWYRPTLEQTLSMTDGMIQHILKGGLILEED